MPQIFQFKNISTIPWVRHAVSTRDFGDLRDSSNRKKFLETIGVKEKDVIDAKQVHADNVVVVRGRDKGHTILQTDALITQKPDLPLFIRVADCVPILLVDSIKRAIGIVHAGWRGTVQEITKLAVQKMKGEFGTTPQDLIAGIGPSIGPCCYEIGTPVINLFAKKFPKYSDKLFSREKENRAHLDLWLANKLQLIEEGVKEENIEVAGLCTFENPDLFFSERREGPVGRFGAIIWIRR